MTPRITIRPSADRDLDEQFYYIAQSSPEAAVRYFRATEDTFARLAASPHLGGVVEYGNVQLAGLRVWQVKGFPNHLIFYRAIEHTASVAAQRRQFAPDGCSTTVRAA